jgi:hypothetical protein
MARTVTQKELMEMHRAAAAQRRSRTLRCALQPAQSVCIASSVGDLMTDDDESTGAAERSFRMI